MLAFIEILHERRAESVTQEAKVSVNEQAIGEFAFKVAFTHLVLGKHRVRLCKSWSRFSSWARMKIGQTHVLGLSLKLFEWSNVQIVFWCGWLMLTLLLLSDRIAMFGNCCVGNIVVSDRKLLSKMTSTKLGKCLMPTIDSLMIGVGTSDVNKQLTIKRSQRV